MAQTSRANAGSKPKSRGSWLEARGDLLRLPQRANPPSLGGSKRQRARPCFFFWKASLRQDVFPSLAVVLTIVVREGRITSGSVRHATLATSSGPWASCKPPDFGLARQPGAALAALGSHRVKSLRILVRGIAPS